MRRLGLLVFAAALGACGARDVIPDADAVPAVGAEEYAIYSEVLRSQLLAHEEGIPVLMDSTLAVPNGPDEIDAYAREQLVDSVAVPEALFRRYDAINRRRYPLAPSLTPGREYRRERFYARYPGSLGTVQFSRAAVNPEHTQALVYYEHGCGNTCGGGSYVVLRREAGGWRVVLSEDTWVS
jgi:hypothetical protein